MASKSKEAGKIQQARGKADRIRVIKFTQYDIAEASGKSITQVRYAIKMGYLDPFDLGSIANYIVGGKQTSNNKE